MTYEEFARINDNNEISIDKVDVKNGVVYSSIGAISSERFIKGVLETKWHISNPAMLKGLFEPHEKKLGMDLDKITSFEALCSALEGHHDIKFCKRISSEKLYVFREGTPSCIKNNERRVYKAYLVACLYDSQNWSYAVYRGVCCPDIGFVYQDRQRKSILTNGYGGIASAIYRHSINFSQPEFENVLRRV